MLNKKQTVEPYLFEGYLMIALHPDWIKIFNKIPTMIAYVDNDKLHIISQEEIQNEFRSR